MDIITVKKHIIGREVLDSYTLIVHGEGWFGTPGGNTGTGTVKIEVRDLNNDVHTQDKDTYSGGEHRETGEKVLMRLKALDVDLLKSDNWLAVFHIMAGKQGDIFTVETDPLTNEDILRMMKPAQPKTPLQEEEKELQIQTQEGGDLGPGGERQVMVDREEVEDKPPDSGNPPKPGGAGDKPESGTKPGDKPSQGGPSKKPGGNQMNPGEPVFHPKVKEVAVSGNPDKTKVHMFITSYPATDGDTEDLAENVRYAVEDDLDDWLIIDETTAEIKLNKLPDPESPFVMFQVKPSLEL
ncbi:desmoglein-2-like protein [Engraulis encrasicolus]|uniref:desmoglein-2-like protein n=1 Tax=Engraulis encrasicolus TaxID=184585 RepID=UPI002FD1F9E4